MNSEIRELLKRCLTPVSVELRHSICFLENEIMTDAQRALAQYEVDNLKSIKADLEAALAAPVQEPGKLSKIFIITNAYEQGVGKGHQAVTRGEIANPYTEGEDCHEAWGLGYAEGKEQAARKALAATVQEPWLQSVTDKIEAALLSHRLSLHQEEDGSGFPLIDALCCGQKSLETGKQEVEDIAETIYHVLAANTPPAQPAHVQEPVGIVAVDGFDKIQVGWLKKPQHNDRLYAAPPAAQPVVPLTDGGEQWKPPLGKSVQEPILKQAIAAAITMLYDGHKEDVLKTFSLSELNHVVEITDPLRPRQVEEIYREAWDLLNTPPPIAAKPAHEIDKQICDAQRIALVEYGDARESKDPSRIATAFVNALHTLPSKPSVPLTDEQIDNAAEVHATGTDEQERWICTTSDLREIVKELANGNTKGGDQ